MTRCALSVAFLLTTALPGGATTWIVAPDGGGDFPTIEDAIAGSAPADTVLLLPGTYSENDLFVSHELTIRGYGDPSAVVLDGSTTGGYVLRPVVPDGAPPFTLHLERLSIRDGYGVRTYNADCALTADHCRFLACNRGIYASYETNRVDLDDCEFVGCTVGVRFVTGSIRNCRFTDNGDGAQLGGSSEEGSVVSGCEFSGHATALLVATATRTPPLEISDCEFHDQRAHSVYVASGGSADVMRCTFTRNGDPTQYDVRGAGVRTSTSSTHVTVSDCRFEDNRARLGGALYFYRGSRALVPLVSRCTFVRNLADRGGVMRSGGLDVRLEDCLLVDNGAVAGGAFEITDADVVSERCTFHGTYADTASAARVDVGSFRATACIFTGSYGDALFRRIDFRSRFFAECCDFYDLGATAPDSTVARMLRDGANFSADPLYCDPAAGSFSIGSASRCAAVHSPCGVRVGARDVDCAPTGVYVGAHPGGRTIVGDGEARTADAFFAWAAGESHVISVPTPQITDVGERYDFRGWDDGGAATHTVTVTGEGVVATADFDVSYRLQMEAWPGGSVTPATSHWPPGTPVQIRATAEDGHAFQGWVGQGVGSYTGPDTTATVIVGEPIVQTARFAPATLITILSDPPGAVVKVHGQPMPTPASFYWATTYAVPLAVDSLQVTAEGERLRYASWSDGGMRSHNVLVLDTPLELTVSFARDYLLTFEPEPNASFAPGDSWWESGSGVQIQAIPRYAYVVESWEGTGVGAYTGPDNPATVTMNGPVHEAVQLGPRFEGAGYEFTISASGEDPFVHTSEPTGTLRPLYLWATCLQRGVAALELSVTGTLEPLHFTTAADVYNVGSPGHPLLAVAHCPTGTDVNLLLGSWTVLDTGGAFCLDAAATLAVDCDQVEPNPFYSPEVTGFSSDGTAPCQVGTNGCADPPPPPPPPPESEPILVSGLQVRAEERQVVVSWKAVDETAVTGFHVYRSDTKDGETARLTPSLLRGVRLEWIDDTVEPMHTYWYAVAAERDATERIYGPMEITTPDWEPMRTAVGPAAPNPSRGRVELRFSLAEPGRTHIEIYDVRGRRVRDLVAADFPSGEHVFAWDGRDDAGRVSPAGMYFARFTVGERRQVRKLLRLSPD